MAVSLLSVAVSDLCLGKPSLPSLLASTSLRDAISALKISPHAALALCTCRCCDSETPPADDHSSGCRCSCVGKVAMVDILCFLCRPENLADPASALKSPVSALLPPAGPCLVRHVQPHCSLLEALDLMLESGAHNLVVPTRSHQHKHAGGAHGEYCWLSQEDVARFLLNSIALFSPLPALSAASLDIVRSAPADVLSVEYHASALSALETIALAQAHQTSVAVLAAPGGALVGEISPATLAACRDEGVAAAIVALSAGELVAYIDGGGPPPEDLVRAVRARLVERGLEGMLQLLDESSYSLPSSSSSSSQSSSSSSSSSSEEEEEEEWPEKSPKGPLRRRRWGSYSARMGRRAEAIVCRRRSSLVAVMAQALAHRVGYVWVVDDVDGYGLAGMVTLSDILGVFRDHLQMLADE